MIRKTKSEDRKLHLFEVRFSADLPNGKMIQVSYRVAAAKKSVATVEEVIKEYTQYCGYSDVNILGVEYHGLLDPREEVKMLVNLDDWEEEL
jgi:hypothetical protein